MFQGPGSVKLMEGSQSSPGQRWGAVIGRVRSVPGGDGGGPDPF